MPDYVPRRLRDKNYRVLRPVRPNVVIETAFRRRLVKLIDEMHKAVRYWVEHTWKSNVPELAQDATPARELSNALARLSRQWVHQFDAAADELAEYFATDVAQRSDAVLRNILRRAGISVHFVMTPAMQDVLEATIRENVNLIKSIPRQYLTDVEGMVMRSVQTGRDLHQLSSDLQHAYGVTKRRAALISRDQNNKATASLNRVRQLELGIRQAIWMHSHAGKKPRPTHVRMDGKMFDVDKGMYDSNEGRNVMPGELINCRCTSRPVIPGL